ncbi:hypothetical protein DV20_28705 [Amycolatopsis rifamycinica]|uniref:Uncharacterized protein n=1 Tax=Amycolatopsis rifamycinica TaxID=287986 RepID=A0A066TTS2_9PSEU|nr:hypothetical protein DV20_28705 [Amycolatopsis rifamycinica]
MGRALDVRGQVLPDPVATIRRGNSPADRFTSAAMETPVHRDTDEPRAALGNTVVGTAMPTIVAQLGGFDRSSRGHGPSPSSGSVHVFSCPDVASWEMRQVPPAS